MCVYSSLLFSSLVDALVDGEVSTLASTRNVYSICAFRDLNHLTYSKAILIIRSYGGNRDDEGEP